MSCLEDPGGISGTHTLTCGTWYSLLRDTSPLPGGFSSTDLQYVSSAWMPQC